MTDSHRGSSWYYLAIDACERLASSSASKVWISWDRAMQSTPTSMQAEQAGSTRSHCKGKSAKKISQINVESRGNGCSLFASASSIAHRPAHASLESAARSVYRPTRETQHWALRPPVSQVS